MKVYLTSIGSINKAEKTKRLGVFLEVNENSKHCFSLDIAEADVMQLTLAEIERLAIEKFINNIDDIKR